MEVFNSWHPFELGRKVSAFWETVKTDLDLRYPEARNRRALELEHLSSAEFTPHDPSILEELRKERSKLSFFEWGILSEWNERYLQARLGIQVARVIVDAESATSVVQRALLQRLREIQLEMQEGFAPESSLFQLLRHRWHWAGLREEASYLISRIRASKKPSSP